MAFVNRKCAKLPPLCIFGGYDSITLIPGYAPDNETHHTVCRRQCGHAV